MARIALIGGTGLIGRNLAPRLIDAGHDLTLLSRRPARFAGATEIIAQASDWPAALRDRTVDVAVSTLGTTWKKAGSWAAFEAVDRIAVVEFARAARQSGARQMIAVSSVGADPHAGNKYLALKGAVEADLAAIGFDRLDIIRPGLLCGERGADRRFAERVGIALSPLFNRLLLGPLERFQAIDAVNVAEAMVVIAGRTEPGSFVHFNRDIHRLARDLTRGLR